MAEQLWLLKAEPDSRIVKGKDVKFSVDDFESVKTSPWEGVRNYEARNLMKEMKTGDKALFYHSNCKTPGIAAFAEVSKEAYPDYTAWDSSHPYYDPKSDSSSPKWYMVDLTFARRAKHFVSLALLKHIAQFPFASGSEDADEELDDRDSVLREEWKYIGVHGAKAIKDMNLLNRGRLSVQRVQKPAWDAITLLAEHGGWDEAELGKAKGKAKGSGKSKGIGKDENGGKKKTRSGTKKKPQTQSKPTERKGKKRLKGDEEEEEEEADDASTEEHENEGESYHPRPRKRRKVEEKADEASKADAEAEDESNTRSRKTRRR